MARGVCPAVQTLIPNPAQGVLGGKLKLLLSGAAPLGNDLHRFMRVCFDVPVPPPSLRPRVQWFVKAREIDLSLFREIDLSIFRNIDHSLFRTHSLSDACDGIEGGGEGVKCIRRCGAFAVKQEV